MFKIHKRCNFVKHFQLQESLRLTWRERRWEYFLHGKKTHMTSDYLDSAIK